MDRTTLVTELKSHLKEFDFSTLQNVRAKSTINHYVKGRIIHFIDAFALVKTLTEYINEIYILGVSSPALKEGILEDFEINNLLIEYLSEKLSPESWRKIDRIRSYPTQDDLKYNASHGFDFDSDHLTLVQDAELIVLG